MLVVQLAQRHASCLNLQQCNAPSTPRSLPISMAVYRVAAGSPRAGWRGAAARARIAPLAAAAVFAFFLLDYGWRVTLGSRTLASGATRLAPCSSMAPVLQGQCMAWPGCDRM